MVFKEFQRNVQMPGLLAMLVIAAAVDRHWRPSGRVTMRSALHLISAFNPVLKSSRMRVADGAAMLLSPHPVLMEGVDVVVAFLTTLSENRRTVPRGDTAVVIA